jgi:predicted SAM-dependent methyltransferase
MTGDASPVTSYPQNWESFQANPEAEPLASPSACAKEPDVISYDDDRFGSDAYQNRLGSMLKFELTSWIGRMLGFLPQLAETKEYLNIGSGAAPHREFTNLDFYAPRTKASLWLKGFSFVQHDLRFPLPFRNESFRGVFSEHCVEHLYPKHAQNLFREVRRVLKPGGVFRCIVPDLARYVACYNKQLLHPEFAHFRYGCEAIWSLTQNWAHVSVWDAEMLTLKLREAGFEDVAVRDFQKGRLPELCIDLETRRWASLYVEAYKH